MERKSYKSSERMKIVCRCNDVTEEEIENIIKEGYTDVEEIKRILGIGMGLCQGNTCMIHVARMLAKHTGEFKIANIRPPESPSEMGVFADE